MNVSTKCLVRMSGLALLITSPVFAQTNLLTTNPSFESSTSGACPPNVQESPRNALFAMPGWSGKNGNTDIRPLIIDEGAPGGGGIRSLSMGISSGIETDPASLASVTGGKAYQLSYQYKKIKDDSPHHYVGLSAFITFYDAAGEVIREYGEEEVQSSGTSPLGGSPPAFVWTSATVDAVAPFAARRAGVRFEYASIGSGPRGQTFVIDDVRLQPASETQDSVGVQRVPMVIERGKEATLAVKYAARLDSEVFVRLLKGNTINVATIRVPAPAGRGEIPLIKVNVPSTAANGSDYKWEILLVPPGSSPVTATARAATRNTVLLDDTVQTLNVVSSNSPHLIFEGRWTSSDPLNPSSTWSGTGVHCRFTGTSLKMRYGCTATGSSVSVLVDGDEYTRKVVNLSSTADETITLVSGLADTAHTIEIMRESGDSGSTWTVRGITLDAGKGLLRHAPFMPRRIEFYGDSTAAGKQVGMWADYPVRTARALGASFSAISKGRTGIGGGAFYSNNGLYYWDRTTFDPNYNAPRWDSNGDGKIDSSDDIVRNPYNPTGTQPTSIDPIQKRGIPWGPGNFDDYQNDQTPDLIGSRGRFSEQPMDAVVIGWGENDQAHVPKEVFIANYRQIVTLLLKVYPTADIFMTHTCMTTGDYIQQAVEPICNDPTLNASNRLHYQTLYPRGEYPAEGHPSAIQHYEAAMGRLEWRGLVDWIGAVKGWTPRTDSGGPTQATVDNSTTSSGECVKTGGWTRAMFNDSNDPATAEENASNYWGADFDHDDNTGKGTKSATYTPNIPRSGTYRVYMRWGTRKVIIGRPNPATNVPVTVTDKHGSRHYVVDQRKNIGVWTLLGEHVFDYGQDTSKGSLEIETTGTDGYVMADVVRFEYQSD